MKSQKGITLIALVITIIVMLILVAVSVSVIINGDLLNTAKGAGTDYSAAQEREANELSNVVVNYINDKVSGS